MVNQLQTPWAVLLCKFKDDSSEPITRQLAQKLFTVAGVGTYNMTRFFHEVSHESLDLSGSQVFGWLTVDVNVNDVIPPTGSPKITRDTVMALAKKTASDQGIPLSKFFGVVLVFNAAVGGSQGGSWGGIPPNVGVFSDYRYVQNNGSQSYGQEMGHAYGLDHSRSDDPNVNLLNCETDTLDYRDAWDVMSTACAYSSLDPDYGSKGPGLNAWNMRGRGWLDELRVWRGPVTNTFDQVIQLSPLLRHDLPGLLAAELPPVEGHYGRYLVEFRIKDGWDTAIPHSAVLVHRFEGIIGQFLGDHSYIMSDSNGKQDMAEGDIFAPSDNTVHPRVEVLKINESDMTATVRLSCIPNPIATGLNGIVGVAGYFTPSDGFQHALVATNNGQVHEVFWGKFGVSPPNPIATGLNGIVGVAGYFTPSDGFQHALVATNNGNVYDIMWH